MRDSTIKETIVVIGFGWVGQANALALTALGYSVFYYDIVEPVRHYKERWAHLYDRVKPLTDPLAHDSEKTCYLLTVGDRVDEEGVQDISLIIKAGKYLEGTRGVVVLRSTVFPESLYSIRFDYYLPEFLHERYAVEECMNPFYFVVGGAGTDRPKPDFFQTLEARAHHSFHGTFREAGYVKYLSNIWNALRIAFVNEFGDLVENSEEKSGSAERVIDFLFQNKSYLRYGKAYGGHCLPKDVLAFWKGSGAKNSPLIRAIHDSNQLHKSRQSKDMPEWFSGWELTTGTISYGALYRFWSRFNSITVVRILRSRLRFLRCFVEGFVPARTLSELKDFWNRLASKNARYFSHSRTLYGKNINEYDFRETGKQEYELLIKDDPVVKEKLGDFGKCTMLDIGTGIGREVEFMAGDFGMVYGIDISGIMIEGARRRLQGLNNVLLTETSGAHIPFANHHFDFVFSHQVFSSFPRREFIETYLGEIARTLKPGGIAKLELRTGQGGYKWKYFSGVSVDANWVCALAKRFNFNVLESYVKNGRSLWVVLEASMQKKEQ